MTISFLSKKWGISLTERKQRELAGYAGTWIKQGLSLLFQMHSMQQSLEAGMPEGMKDFIQKNVESPGLLNAYDRLAKRGIPRAVRRKNESKNREWVRHNAGNLFSEDDYIETQKAWNGVRLGKKYTVAYSGCEIIAVYNALVCLGMVKDREAVICGLITRFEEKGLALRGAAGTSPRELYRYFEEQGHETALTVEKDEKTLEEFGKKYRAVIATVYNDADDICGQIHTVCIDKNREGRYRIHNAANAAGKSFPSLHEAIAQISGKKTLFICATGVNNGKAQNMQTQSMRAQSMQAQSTQNI